MLDFLENKKNYLILNRKFVALAGKNREMPGFLRLFHCGQVDRAKKKVQWFERNPRQGASHWQPASQKREVQPAWRTSGFERLRELFRKRFARTMAEV